VIAGPFDDFDVGRAGFAVDDPGRFEVAVALRNCG